MNIYKLIVYIITIVIFFFNIRLAGAHGLIYETNPVGENEIRITLKWSSEADKKGIAITHFYLENAKTLNIGYEVKDGLPHTAYLDYDLKNVIPPIRINLENISDIGWIPFMDIHGIEAEEYITHLHDAGIVNGRPDGTFKPEDPITRAEFVVLLVEALKLEDSDHSLNEFTDIEGHWAKDMLLTAAKHGLISGYEDNTVRPDKFITLAEVSSVISRAFSFETSRNGIYGKIRRDRWYSNSVKKMFDVGILAVHDSIYTGFDEEKNINRASCAMMVSRALSTY